MNVSDRLDVYSQDQSAYKQANSSKKRGIRATYGLFDLARRNIPEHRST